MKRVFITGGASGLGRALALHYARSGWSVCIADVNDERGRATALELGEHGLYMHADVMREADLMDVAARLEQDWGGVDLLVNNAGVAQAGGIDEVSMSDWSWIVEINLLGVVRGCKVFTPIFKRQGNGHILNIASMAGLLDVPRMAAYNTTKAAVVALSTTLHQELQEHGIHVSVACPSFFQTNLHETMRSTDPHLMAVTRKMLAKGRMDADEVARLIARGVEKRKMFILPHGEGRLSWMLKRWLPHGLYSRMITRATRFLNRQQ